MRIPGAGELDRIAPAAPPPYAAPVLLTRGQTWTEGRPLELALHKTPSSAASSLAFGSTSGPIPDLLVSDGARALLLRPGQVTITGVAENRTPPRAMPLHVSVAPNPFGERAEIRVFDAAAQLTSGQLDAMVFDVQGRLVRRIRVGGAPTGAAGGPSDASGRASVSASSARIQWDGRDDRGRRLSSGRYWLRVKQGDRIATLPMLILR
jgi:hypothetical protein